jgi:hypothetical protein
MPEWWWGRIRSLGPNAKETPLKKIRLNANTLEVLTRLSRKELEMKSKVVRFFLVCGCELLLTEQALLRHQTRHEIIVTDEMGYETDNHGSSHSIRKRRCVEIIDSVCNFPPKVLANIVTAYWTEPIVFGKHKNVNPDYVDIKEMVVNTLKYSNPWLACAFQSPINEMSQSWSLRVSYQGDSAIQFGFWDVRKPAPHISHHWGMAAPIRPQRCFTVFDFIIDAKQNVNIQSKECFPSDAIITPCWISDKHNLNLLFSDLRYVFFVVMVGYDNQSVEIVP